MPPFPQLLLELLDRAMDQDLGRAVGAAQSAGDLADELLRLFPPVDISFLADVEIADVEDPHFLFPAPCFQRRHHGCASGRSR